MKEGYLFNANRLSKRPMKDPQDNQELGTS